MKKTITKAAIAGEINAIASKSVAHRMMIAAALTKAKGRHSSDTDVTDLVDISESSKDIEATRKCLKEVLKAVNATGDYAKSGALSARFMPSFETVLPCEESGSTLRFLLPIVGALGIEASFMPKGRLPERPLSPLYEEMEKHGCKMSKQGEVPFKVSGKLRSGVYEIDGGISSQFITGLLFALPLVEGDSVIKVKGNIESRPYVDITLDILKKSGIQFNETAEGFEIKGNQEYDFKVMQKVEGDWSNAAFWLSLGALSDEGVTVKGLNLISKQGDKKIIDILSEFGANILLDERKGEVKVKRANLRAIEVDVKDIPDLVPIISVVAAASVGKTKIINAGRLRIKESDRLSSVHEMLNALGVDVKESKDGMEIDGMPDTGFKDALVDSFNDHRIAMSAAIAAALGNKEITIEGAEAVEKSYPGFFEDYSRLGGEYN